MKIAEKRRQLRIYKGLHNGREKKKKKKEILTWMGTEAKWKDSQLKEKTQSLQGQPVD